MFSLVIKVALCSQVISVAILEVMLLFGVQTIPHHKMNQVLKRDVESVRVEAEKSGDFKYAGSFEAHSKPLKFRWSSNDSFMEDLEDMFASIERELDELLNTTKTKVSDGLGFNDEFFSFSFSDSQSDSASESEETPAPEPAAEEVEAR